MFLETGGGGWDGVVTDVAVLGRGGRLCAEEAEQRDDECWPRC